MKNNIRELRLLYDVSIEELASSCNVSLRHMYRLEDGTSEPLISTAYRIATQLGKPVDQIWSNEVLNYN